ncbi:MAG: Crp/Fnr family transcriptional regulator [Cytophagia bacterium]|jgi:CRP/FNR family transcriptional regulator, anaerobic regulatory protein|nr:MAG: Crp/Fnr family transcriptional regulator [Runella sp.]TAG19346.1 MAG: Crp/Fnr family transcriptional regulator [Cytophagales bacterium]TAG38610.1 MAG: Crp/Fnr family transcriptional regulator [Cytophagia bacterium]TAG57183.1 MAG: Crp/Fnr family transcriptional regulator [Runella slithyformis]TAG80260.1 MAG: Crp/Fnr family transcriptional regulator [Cytophagales bacterium]
MDNINKRAFIEAVTNFEPLSSEVVDFILPKLQVHRLPKGTALLTLDDVCDRLYFLHTGLAYAYYAVRDQEITSWFAKERDFIYSPQSFLKREPAQEAIMLLENAVLVSLTFDDMEAIYDTYPITNKIGRLITEHYILQYDERARLLRSYNVEQRFKLFVEANPALHPRLPFNLIASFLGTASVTLSRILSKKMKCSNSN